MRTLLLILLILIIPFETSALVSDSTRTKLKAACTVSINSNGISTIPAFSLGDPAVMSFITLSKGRFSYDPVLAYGLDMRPWFIDNWLHYHIVEREAFTLRTGINFSVFFSELKLPEEEVLQGERYWALELAGIWKITSKTLLTMMYWNDRGQDPGTITGHYISLAGEIQKIRIGKFSELAFSAQLFYIDYTGENDGLFISPKITAYPVRTPIWLVFQANQPLVTNISPNPGFEWNVGFGISF